MRTPAAVLNLMMAAAALGAEKPALLPRDAEIAMALSAAPEHLRAGAAVYVLGPRGYLLARAGGNGFTCIVHRDHPLNRKPTCWDREGSQTIVPAVLFEGELLMQGKPVAEIKAALREGFASGRFVSPRRPGIAYMLGENRNYNPRTGTVEVFPPHVMFYAPYLTDADIGSKGGDDGLPFIAYQGPHGYMIGMLPAARTSTEKSAPEQDRQRLAAHLEMTAQWLADEVSGLSAAQLRFRPSPGSWSVLETVEHLTIAEPVYWRRMQTAQERPADWKPEVTDADILWAGIDRTQRAKTEADQEPAGGLTDVQAGVGAIEMLNRVLVEYARAAGDLRRVYLEKEGCDGYQWLLGISTHREGHIGQIREIKRAAGFPRQ